MGTENTGRKTNGGESVGTCGNSRKREGAQTSRERVDQGPKALGTFPNTKHMDGEINNSNFYL